MTTKVRILFLSANPWSTSRILVDKEAREIFEKLEEGDYRDRFELFKHTALRPGDLQRLLLKHRPHIVHFSGHGSKVCKLIVEGGSGRGKRLDPQGLVDIFRLYNSHIRLVMLNACFTRTQAQALTEVIDYAIGISKAIGDRAGVMFAAAFYRALGFGRSIAEAYEMAKAELRLIRMPRSQGIELFVRNGMERGEIFPDRSLDLRGADVHPSRAVNDLIASEVGAATQRTLRTLPFDVVRPGWVLKQAHESFQTSTHFIETSTVSYFRVRVKHGLKRTPSRD